MFHEVNIEYNTYSTVQSYTVSHLYSRHLDLSFLPIKFKNIRILIVNNETSHHFTSKRSACRENKRNDELNDSQKYDDF